MFEDMGTKLALGVSTQGPRPVLSLQYPTSSIFQAKIYLEKKNIMQAVPVLALLIDFFLQLLVLCPL